MRVARNGVPIGILSSNRTTYRSLLAVFLWLYFTLWLSRTAVWKSSLEKIFSTRRASYSQGRSVILFLAPKQGFSLIPSQIVAWQNVLQSIGGRIKSYCSMARRHCIGGTARFPDGAPSRIFSWTSTSRFDTTYNVWLPLERCCWILQ